MPNVIADTSPIQYLYQTNLLDLLPQIYCSITIPQAVVNELAEGLALGISLPDVTSLSWLKIEVTEVAASLQKISELGSGEKEALTLALSREDSLVIVDDGLARNYAKQFDIKVTGTLGILLKAKQLGYLDSLAPVLNQLESLGFHLASSTRMNVLQLAEE